MPSNQPQSSSHRQLVEAASTIPAPSVSGYNAARHQTDHGGRNSAASASHTFVSHSTNGARTLADHQELVLKREAIAVCGMAVRLPGGLHSPQALWDFLIAKGDALGSVPASRPNVAAFQSATRHPGDVASPLGHFLDSSVDLSATDAAMFSMPRTELEKVDPHQRLMLEVTRECLEDAGETGWRGARIGCYMGSFGEDWCDMLAKDPQLYGQYRTTGAGDFMLANRVSYEMDLRGPSMTVRTACSAALVALHDACRAIQSGDCDSALVGGANLLLAPGMTGTMAEQGVLSLDGSCKTFSADANGYSRGEAVTAAFLKPVHAALRDGNPVRSIIRSTATNSDGKAPGVTMPNGDAKEDLIRHAYTSVA